MKQWALIFILCSAVLVQAQSHQPNKLPLCVSCHGLRGISSNPTWPNLNGQHKKYFIKQIKDMKNKDRQAPLMYAVVKDMTLQEIDDIAAYYAKMPPIQGGVTKKPFSKGKELYQQGDFNKGILACIICHSPKGNGNAEAGFPALANQHAAYLVQQLLAFKQRKRINDLNQVMQDICKRMNIKEMKAVANYIEGLEPC